MKLKPILTLGTFVVFASGTLDLATADPTSKKNQAPLNQAIESVDKNLQKNPENPGLPHAREQLQSNQQKIEQRRTEHEEGRRPSSDRHATHADRPERARH